MRVRIGGIVKDSERRTYRRQDGGEGVSYDVWLDAGRYTERVSGPEDLCADLVKGSEAEFVANIKAAISKDGRAYLSVWLVERITDAAPAAKLTKVG